MSSLTYRWLISAAVTCALVCAIANGQSGRRSKGTIPPGTSTPTPPADAVARENPAPQLHLLIARESTSRRLPSEEAIYNSFLERLQKLDTVAVEALGEIKQSEATKRAKSEADKFVVLLQFKIDSFQSGTILLDSPHLEVKYFVFAPATGKRRSHGKLYYQSLSGPKLRRDNWPKGPPIKITTEAAGIEAAELVHEWILLEVNARKRAQR